MDMNGMNANKRNRTLLGLAVVAISVMLAAILAGFGFAAAGGGQAANGPAQSQYGGQKLKVCHHTHSLRRPVVTITIPASAWAAHHKHGDTLGACTAKQIKHAKAVAHRKLVKLALAQLRKHGKHVVVVKKGQHVVVVKNGHGKKK